MKTWGSKSLNFAAIKWQHWDLNLTLSPSNFYSSPQLFQPIAIFSHCCLSTAIPQSAATSSRLQQHLLHWYMLWLLRKIKFSDERNPIGTFSLAPWQSLLLQGGQEYNSLLDLLKVTSNQHWNRFKHKYAKKCQLSFKDGPLQKAHMHLYLSPLVSAYKCHLLPQEGKTSCLYVWGNHKWSYHKKINWWPKDKGLDC